jgi:hypothetical protein
MNFRLYCKNKLRWDKYANSRNTNAINAIEIKGGTTTTDGITTIKVGTTVEIIKVGTTAEIIKVGTMAEIIRVLILDTMNIIITTMEVTDTITAITDLIWLLLHQNR